MGVEGIFLTAKPSQTPLLDAKELSPRSLRPRVSPPAANPGRPPSPLRPARLAAAPAARGLDGRPSTVVRSAVQVVNSLSQK